MAPFILGVRYEMIFALISSLHLAYYHSFAHLRSLLRGKSPLPTHISSFFVLLLRHVQIVHDPASNNLLRNIEWLQIS